MFCTPIWGATSKQPDLGVPAISMGGAFVAVANDATAINWNPAAIAALQRQELNLSYADRFGLGLSESYLGYVLPVTESHALGIDWFYRGFDDVSSGLGLDAGLNRLGIAYGYRNNIQLLRQYVGNSSIGFTGRYISQEANLDGATAMKASGFGLDTGLLVPLPHGIRFGLAVHDIGGTGVKHESGLSEEIMSSHIRLGLAYKPPVEGLTIATDIDDHFRIGAEYWVRGQLALRAGIKSELETPESRGDATTFSAGFGLKYRFVQFDYAYENHPILDASHYTSIALAYNPRVVSIKNATIRPTPIFRSLYRHYQENDFFDVVLANSAPEPVTVNVGLMLPKVMTLPHTETIELPPQSTEKYTFKVTFDQDLFNRPEAFFDNFVTPTVQVRYTRNRRDQLVEKQLERVYIAGKGKVSWNVDGMAAAFVTPADLAVAGISRGLVQRYSDMLASKFNRSNIGKAMLLFDAMGVYKIRYQADQKTPFAKVSDDRTIFDTVQYPSELLDRPEGISTKIGDCDDLTVLYASLLENLSIDTAFLEANEPGKGHIYLMFDSGVRPDRTEDHFIDESEYVEWEGRIWIPVETTMFGFTFADAWRNGVNEYKRLKARKLIDEIYVQQWMQTYKPAILSPVNANLPLDANIDSLLSRDIAFVDQRTDQIALGSITSLDTPDGAYDAGVAYLRANHLEKALHHLNQVLDMAPRHDDALNAKGVVLTKQGQYDDALSLYQRALNIDDNAAVRMNIALTYYLKGERDLADMMFEEVVQLDESYSELFEFLSGVGDAQGFYEIGVSYLRQLRVDQALEQFGLALEADPDYADALNARGVVLCRKGQYDEALLLFDKASAIDPKQKGYRLNIAIAHHLNGNRRKADIIYQQVVAQDESYEGLFDFMAASESAEEIYRIASGYMHQEQWNKALERIDQALVGDPDNGHSYNAKGVIFAHQGNFDQAYDFFEHAETLLPNNHGVRINMAIVRYMQGRRHEAAVIYEQVVQMDPRFEGFLPFLSEE